MNGASEQDVFNERAAASLGVPVRQIKLKALVLSAAFTSIAGSIYSIKIGFVGPESGFGLLVSVQMLITAALGAGRLFGPLVGALILVPLQAAANTWFGGGGSGLTYILYGGIIVLLARFEPGRSQRVLASHHKPLEGTSRCLSESHPKGVRQLFAARGTSPRQAQGL